MKKFKILLSAILVFSLLFSMTLTIGATDITGIASDVALSYVADMKTYIEQSISDNGNSATRGRASASEVNLDTLVSDFIVQYGSNYDADALANSGIDSTIVVDEDNKIVVKGLVVEVFGKEKTIEVTPEMIKNGAIDTASNKGAAEIQSISASGTTDIVGYYFAAYGAILGQELWRITQRAQFTYTGSGVTVQYAEGFYTRGVLSIWQVSNWKDSTESSIYVNNVWTKKVTSSGNFHFGLEYDGNGLVVQDYYVTIDARCTVDGVTSGYYTVD